MKDKEHTRPLELTRKEVWALVLATFRTTMPLVIGFCAVLLLLTWILTELLFAL